MKIVVERGRVWRYQNGTFTLIAGLLRYGDASGPLVDNESAFRSMNPTGAIEGCNGDTYIWGNTSVFRVDAAGLVQFIAIRGWDYNSAVAGFCGNIFASPPGSLLTPGLVRIETNDTTTDINDVTSQSIIGADSEGNLYLPPGVPSQFLTRRRALNGSITNLVQMSAATSTPDGFVGVNFGYFGPNTTLLRFRSGSFINVTRIDDTLPFVVPDDGVLGNVAVGIRAIAHNSPTSLKLTVLDRGLLREVDLEPAIVRVDAPQVPAVAPQPRVGAPQVSAATPSARVPAPSSG